MSFWNLEPRFMRQVEKRYNRSSNSLKWNKDRVRELESKLASLEQLTELVEHYKHSSEEQSKNVRELEGTVTALEIYLVRVEDDYKQKFENEALAKKEIEKLTKLVELHKGSSEEWSQKARKLEEMVTVLEELLLGNDAAATIERQFSSEISRLTELVELYKDSSEEWSKMARDLEGTVMVLEKGKNALPRRKATWSEKEVQALIAGVEKYGTGFWRQILKDAE